MNRKLAQSNETLPQSVKLGPKYKTWPHIVKLVKYQSQLPYLVVKTYAIIFVMRLDYEINVCVPAINFYLIQLIIRSINLKK